MSDAMRNFTLRLSEVDHEALEAMAAELGVDRTGALRLLIRRAALRWLARDAAYFLPLMHGGGVSSRPLPIRLKAKG